jgi:chorismate-pyruvate lyase
VRAGEPVLTREVVLVGARTGTHYVYAESLVVPRRIPPQIADALLAGRIGIGELIQEERLETYREIMQVEYGPAGERAADMLELPEDEPMFSRSYLISVGGEPAVLVTEHMPVVRFSGPPPVNGDAVGAVISGAGGSLSRG